MVLYLYLYLYLYFSYWWRLFRLCIGGGSYETVLVILQDLAATELEEAFDHIDVVVKQADTALVIVDGVKS